MKDVLHARNVATEIERQLKENRRLQAEKARQLQIEKDIKEKEAKRRALEKAKIAALISTLSEKGDQECPGHDFLMSQSAVRYVSSKSEA